MTSVAPGAGHGIRVLVVDDSPVARRSVARLLERDPQLRLAGVAENGKVALDRLDHVRPDVILLDLQMPVMDGLATLRALRRQDRRIPVIIFSRLSADGARETLDAEALGAAGFVLKPSALDESAGDGGSWRHELVPLLKAVVADHRPARTPATPQSVPQHRETRAVVLAVSTGGPAALNTIVAGLPADLPIPLLIVQHMPAEFTGILAERLNSRSQMVVTEATDRETVEPGHIYLAPGGIHLAVAVVGGRVQTTLWDGPQENSCKPAADVLFRTAAEAFEGRLLGVVLTGMGQDGLRGSGVIRGRGGSVVVQNPATAVVGSMPRSVAEAGLANRVLSLDQVAPEIVARTARGSAP